MKPWIANTLLVIGAVIAALVWITLGVALINKETMPDPTIRLLLQFAWGGFGGYSVTGIVHLLWR